MSKTNLRLLHLEAENVKILKAMALEPNENKVIVIGGNNATGKSTAIDTLEMLLAGKSSFDETPIRKGEEKAYIMGEFGTDPDAPELTVTRRIAKTDSLTVENKDGAKFGSPQAMLDGLYGKITGFDPGRFATLGRTAAGRREQREVLMEVLDLDTSGIDEQRATLYAQRTEQNVLLKNAQMALQNIPEREAPTERVDVAEILKQMDVIRAGNASNDQARAHLRNMEAGLSAAETEAATVNSQIAEIDRRIEFLQKERAGAAESLTEANRKAEEFLDSIAEARSVCESLTDEDLTPLKDQIEQADELNRAFDAVAIRTQAQEDVASYQKQVDHYTLRIEEIDQKKEEVIASADFGIEGLGFTEDDVTLNGVSLSQASSAEQLRVAVRVAFRACPVEGIRVALIREGSLFDQASLDDLYAIAEEQDGLILLERVIVPKKGEPGYDEACAACTVVFEDGSMRGNPEPELKAKKKSTRKKTTAKNGTRQAVTLDAPERGK